jgi:methionyl-tRNA formyltransferase
LQLVFAGTPEFALPSLRALIGAGHTVRAVYTQPDRPAGRGKALRESPVKRFARERGLEVRTPATLKDADSQAELAVLKPDAMIVVAYGLLLPQAVLDIPRYGCINVHASLLPRWRGAAPIARAIETGDAVTGVTIMQMAAGLDTGPMLRAVETPIAAEEKSQTLHDRLAELGATALVATLREIESGTVHPAPQNDALATYAKKLTREEARLDWSLPADVLARKVRAFNPAPITYTTLNGETLRVLVAHAVAGGGEPGSIVRAETNGIAVAASSGLLVLDVVQLQGRRPMAAREFLNGRPLPAGTMLGT